MTERDIMSLISLARHLWPDMRWTADVEALFVERLKRLNVSYAHACSMLRELRDSRTHSVGALHQGTLLRTLEALDPDQVRVANSPKFMYDDPREWPRWYLMAMQLRCPPNMSPRDVIALYARTEARRHERLYGTDRRRPRRHIAAYIYASELVHQGITDVCGAIAEAQDRFGAVPDSVFADLCAPAPASAPQT